MFDDYAKGLFRDIPEFEGLVQDEAVRALSQAYLAIMEYRINQTPEDATRLSEVQPFLRRLANTLIFHLVLNEEQPAEERQAASFVAAEAIALMADYLAVARLEEDENVSEIRSAERFARLESSLLYLYARYDACAAGVLPLPTSPTNPDTLIDRAASWCFESIEKLCRLRLHPRQVEQPFLALSSATELDPQELEEDTIARLYLELGDSAVEFCDWLVGEEAGLENAVSMLDGLIDGLSSTTTATSQELLGYEYGRIFHLAVLLRLCCPALGERALVHVVPSPLEGDAKAYRRYLEARAEGNSNSQSRPVLWPSAFEYVRQCIIGGAQHCVAAMPTGSGKSFVGELAVSQAVQEGWVLYLAPTNALTEQIRGDLRSGLEKLETEVFAFIGDQEYSIFSTERVDQMPRNSVAVMTPEKCALALRLSPDAFSDCRLVVFDECHLIGETNSTRGPVAELVLTQLMMRAENCRFLLMSAIVQNPNELAEWLSEATGGKSEAVRIRWRPTRTLRAVLGVDNASVQERGRKAVEKLKSRSSKYVNEKFKAQCSLAVSLQGAWKSEDEIDYAVAKIACEAPLKAVRKKLGGSWKYNWEGESWVNQCAITLGKTLVESNIQTLVFTPASKHYPFNNGKKVSLAKKLLRSLPAPAAIVDTCRYLAQYELGADSLVFSLLDKGVAVHTSLMLETEKIAAENMFRSRSAPLMFATGTLAQGLNLPAIAVIIAGSRIGDPRGEAQEEVQRRKFSQLLNAAGRAGRAGFANQGLVVAVPDDAVAFNDFNSVKEARAQVDFLQQSDDSVKVRSGLTDFLDRVCANTLRSDQANDTELQVISLLAGGDANQLAPEPVLRRTFAAYLRRKAGEPEVTKQNAERLLAIGSEFIQTTQAPEWLTVAAQRAGLDFFLTLAISKAWDRVCPQLPPDYRERTVIEWRDELLEVVANIPPGLLTRQIGKQSLANLSASFKTILDKDSQLVFITDPEWTPSKQWKDAWKSTQAPLDAWMSGASLVEIASILTDQPVDSISTDRVAGKPIPRTLAAVQDGCSALSLIAGGYLAVAEQELEGDIPLPLAGLPMSIKYGCDSPGALAWFRFGVRLRRPSRFLADKFPPPPEIETDDELKEWVRNARRQWIRAEGDYDEPEQSIRRFVTNS